MLLSTASGANYWTSIRLIKLYESACRGREEKPRLGIIRALQAIPPYPKPRVIHLVLHDVQPAKAQPAPYPLERALNRHGAEALADVLAVEWALSELKLERGAVETVEALKPILHALLVSGTLPSLSLAGNKKIKAEGWALVAEFLKRVSVAFFLCICVPVLTPGAIAQVLGRLRDELGSSRHRVLCASAQCASRGE